MAKRSRPYVEAPADKAPVKLLIFAPEFFMVSMKKMNIESDPVANRTYFVVDGKIMAVGDYVGGASS